MPTMYLDNCPSLASNILEFFFGWLVCFDNWDSMHWKGSGFLFGGGPMLMMVSIRRLSSVRLCQECDRRDLFPAGF